MRREKRDAILRHLLTGRPVGSAPDIALALNRGKRVTNTLLGCMALDGEVWRIRHGYYCHPSRRQEAEEFIAAGW